MAFIAARSLAELLLTTPVMDDAVADWPKNRTESVLPPNVSLPELESGSIVDSAI